MKKYEIIISEDDLEDSFIKIKNFISEHTGEASEMDISRNRALEQMKYVFEPKSLSKNIFAKVEDSKKIIYNYVSENYPDVPADVHNNLIDVLSLLILTKNTSLLQVQNGRIVGVNNLMQDKKGMYYCNIDKIKPFKHKKDVDEEDEDLCKSQNGEEYPPDMIKFRSFLNKYQKSFS